MLRTNNVCLALLLFFSMLLSSFNWDSDREHHLNGFAQGTSFHITYWAPDSVLAKEEIDSIFSSLDSSLSIYKPYSLINRFNQALSGIEVDEHLLKVSKRSLEIFNDTEGKFDITVYPLVTAWGFGSIKINKLPDSSEIVALLPCIGSNNLSLNGNQLTKRLPCVKIDVNGIAQGYSVDVIAKYLQKRGLKNFLVEVGGELRVQGKKPGGILIKVGIESPALQAGSEPIITKIISLTDGAITTSGNYRKYVESGGRRLTHLIDPKTGFPISGEMVSVTVYARDAITADGYDNALMAMNVNDALRFVSKRTFLEAYFIYRKADGLLADTATAGFNKLMSVDKKI